MSKPSWLEPLEQTAHFFMGFGARLVFLDYLLWRREAVTQWPPGDTVHLRLNDGPPPHYVGYEGEGKPYAPHDRVWDMMTDMRWYFIGGTCADVVRVVVLAVYLLRS
jgi:hypothetical protein